MTDHKHTSAPGFRRLAALRNCTLAVLLSLPMASAFAQTKPTFTHVAAGDLLGPWKSRAAEKDPQLEEVMALFRNADVGFANLEGNMFDLDTFKGAPAAENGGFEQGGVGSGPRFDPELAEELKAMGINTLSLANNHTMDWDDEGLTETIRVLDAAGVMHSGAGASLQQARAPAYLQTPGGKVAMISAAATFLPNAPAGPGDAASRRGPRPGLSMLRNTVYTRVDAAEFEVLKRIAARQAHVVADDATKVTIMPNEATFTGQHFRKVDVAGGVDYELHAKDREEILAAVSEGRNNADKVVFNIHAHESDTGAQDHQVPGRELQPPEFVKTLMRDAVDAGADIGIVHGPHSLRGIEIYKGKPIFYGMGSLFFEIPSSLYDWPADWFDTYVAESKFKDDALVEVRLHPLRIRRESDTPEGLRIGAPRKANAAEARQILRELQDASAKLGTKIHVKGGIGVIRVNDDGKSH